MHTPRDRLLVKVSHGCRRTTQMLHIALCLLLEHNLSPLGDGHSSGLLLWEAPDKMAEKRKVIFYFLLITS